MMKMDEQLEKRFAIHQKMMQVLFTASAKGVDAVLATNFCNEHLFLALHAFFVKGDDKLARQHLFTCGMLDVYGINKFNSRLLDYGIARLCNAILSDSGSLLDVYANQSYKGDGKNYPDMDVMVKEGELPIYCNSIQKIIMKDWEGLAQNLDIMKKLTLPKSTDSSRPLDFEFYEALLEKNHAKANEVVNELASPENHNQRNADPLWGKYITQPALGYAKLARLNGMEITVNSKFAPAELIEIKPLEKYEIAYPFLNGLL